jgi:hypothetical protein
MKIAPDDIWMRIRFGVWVFVFIGVAMLVGNFLLKPGSYWKGLAMIVAATVAANVFHNWAERWWQKRSNKS